MANEVAVEPGNLVYTAMLNARGGIVSDLTVKPYIGRHVHDCHVLRGR